MKALLLVGAGHAHLEVLRRFVRRPLPGVQLTLLTRARHVPYSGMLPGLIAGQYGFTEAHTDVAALARWAGARLVLGTATGLNMARQRVRHMAGADLAFDVVSLDIGSQPNTDAVPGASKHAIPVKPIDGFLGQFEALLARVPTGCSWHVVVVGGGAGGVELMLSAAHRLQLASGAVRFTLVAGSAAILPGFPPAFRARLEAVLAQRGITVRTGARVTAVHAGGVMLADGSHIAADEVLWAVEAAPARWLAETGLPVDPHGFLRVDAQLQAAEGVFAAGDMTAFAPGAIARSGVQAVRAGPVLAANLRATLTGGRLRRFRPRETALAIVSTGAGHAVGARSGLAFEGRWVWWLKDHIDRRFMARFRMS